MTNQLQSAKYFDTSELCLATTLLYLEYPLVKIDRNKPKSSFYFNKTPDLGKVVQSYWNGDIKVEPKQWFNAQREIKSRLYGTS